MSIEAGKYISFSFDDGRKDTYSVAYPILRRYGFTCTVNVITDFVENPSAYSRYGLKEAMSIKDVVDMQNDGNEIACHGHTHTNSYSDVCDCINILKSWGVAVDKVGFASPFSKIVPDALCDMQRILDENKVSYIRTGIQVRREGFFYSALVYLCEKTGFKNLFARLNRRAVYSYPVKSKVMLGISITSNTTVDQVIKLIDSAPVSSSMVLIFHSILNQSDCYDRWCWSADNFDLLCSFLANRSDCKVVNTNELIGER